MQWGGSTTAPTPAPTPAAPAPAPTTTSASTTPTECGERLLVVGSRGSGDSYTGNQITTKYGLTAKGLSAPGTAFAVDLANALPSGAVTFLANPYPAVGLTGGWRAYLNFFNAITRIPGIGAYNNSVKDGETDLRQIINNQVRLCPHSYMLLVGYSQGSQVTGDVYESLSTAQRSLVLGVVLFGDPKFNGGDKAADQGSYTPSRSGGLGTRATFPAGGHVRSYCHARDPVCQGALPSFDLGMHTNYDTSTYPAAAAAYFASLL